MIQKQRLILILILFLANIYLVMLSVSQENYIHIASKCMQFDVFKVIKNFGLKMCLNECETIPICRSVSFNHDKKQCLISSSNDQMKLYNDTSCSYHQKIVDSSLCGSTNCSAKSTCVKFKNGISKCIIQRCDSPLIYEGSQYVAENERCTRYKKVPCNVTGELTFSCTAEGVWSSGNDICTDCDASLEVDGTEYAPKNMLTGTNVTVPCTLTNTTAHRVFTCSQNGQWMKTLDTCTYCGEPVIVDGITYTSVNQPEGRALIVPCANGASGSRYLICDKMGTWNETQNTCQDCDSQLIVDSVQYASENMPHGMNFNIACINNNVVGSRIFTCSTNGSWVNTDDTCQDCDSPLIVDGITYTDTFQPLATTVIVPCKTTEDGYTFIGNRTYTCNSDGTWWLITNGCHGFAFKIFQSYSTSTFHQARQDCQSEGADLAIPDTQEKFDVLSDAVSVHVSNTNSEYYFIGMTDLKTEGLFKWVDGRNVSFNGWDTGQPANWNNEQHCGIYQKPSMKWHDFNCDINCNFICEKTIQITK